MGGGVQKDGISDDAEQEDESASSGETVSGQGGLEFGVGDDGNDHHDRPEGCLDDLEHEVGEEAEAVVVVEDDFCDVEDHRDDAEDQFDGRDAVAL